MIRTGLGRATWYRGLFEGVRKAWSWAQRRHLPGLVSVVALALLLVAERKLLKDVLHAQEGLRDALTDLKQTIHDELGAAQSALQDTRILEHDIRSKLDALHGGGFDDVPLLTRALKNELDAGVARARDVVSTIGAAGGGRKDAGSVVADLETLSLDLAEARRIATEVEQRARDADEKLGGGFDGGTPAFPDLHARAARIADKLAEADAMMFPKDPSSTGLWQPAALGKNTRAQPGGPPSETFPPLYQKARELSVAMDRTSARLFGDGGIPDGAELGRRIHDIQLRLELLQARLDQLDVSVRTAEAAFTGKTGTHDAGVTESTPLGPR